MNSPYWFDDLPVIGKMSPTQAAKKLMELREKEAAQALEQIQHKKPAQAAMFGTRLLWPFHNRSWQHTAHAFGYFGTNTKRSGVFRIEHAGNISPDNSLKNSRIKITLDCIRVADYPGFGEHLILFDFYAQNQLPRNTEHLHFNITCRALEGERAAIIGYPIFVGLNVGREGVAFKCFTVNVKNKKDETFLSFMESDIFRSGLKLASTIQPAIGPLSGMAVAITKAIACRYRNVPIQDFYMGLDFSNIPTRARLSEGSYIAVQIPEKDVSIWDWSKWVYNPDNANIVNKDNKSELIPFNYIVFSISRHEQQE